MLRLDSLIVVATTALFVLQMKASYAQETAVQSEAISPPETGTLNLLLANQRGFVIAADSRRTRLSPLAHWDDSQKLFRVGPKSAMVIAGFASWAAQGSPLDVQVAAVFRDEFDDHDWNSGTRSVEDLRGTIGVVIGYQLRLFGSIYATLRPAPRPEDLLFQALAARVGRNGKLQVLRFGFIPRIEQWGPLNLNAPEYDIKADINQVNGFVAYSAGMQAIAREILDNTINTTDDRILKYYQLRNSQRLDQAPLEVLQDLATAILEETKRATPLVGGSDQIGVFTQKGRCVRWSLPNLPLNRQKSLSTVLNIGNTYTVDGHLTPQEYRDAKGKKFSTELNLSLVQPFEQPFTQVFVAARFRGVQISLDGNAFVGNEFNGVTFKFQGRPTFFANNILNACILELPSNANVPQGLTSCAVKHVAHVDLGRTLGAPVRAEPHGCVTRNKYGRAVIKTTGRQKGKDCKESRITVPIDPLGTRARQ